MDKVDLDNNFTEEEQITSLLSQWDDAYFNKSEPIVSDAQYDAMKARLRYVNPDSNYFKKVGAPVKDGKVKLPYQMGSLNQIYKGELSSWVQKYLLVNEKIIVTDKLDGVSCLLVYRDCYFSRAYSRGDGYEGQDITKHFRYINFPKVLKGYDSSISKDSSLLVVRAELIMKKEVFASKYANEFKNPRNLVAGVFNRKESAESILCDIDLVTYEIIDLVPTDNTKWPMEKLEMLSYLENHGFSTARSHIVHGDDLSDEFLEKLILKCKKESSYELDGVVLTINKWNDINLQSVAQTLNPEHSIKYKILDESNIQEAEVVKVHWEISKSGYMKPRVEIKPVHIGGVTITYATGFNGGFIESNKIGPGARVKITRSGDVIPYILEVTKGTTPDLPLVDYTWTYNNKEEKVEIVLSDKTNPEVIFKQVLDFFTSLDVELLKEASLREIFIKFDLDGQSYTDILGTIFDLTEHELESVIGVNGRKIYASLHRRLENMSMPLLMGSLNYCGVGFGVKKATTLLEQMDWEDLQNLESHEPIAALRGFDDKTAINVFAGIPQIRNFLERFADYIVFKQETKSSELSHLNVVMTGFRDKNLQQKIELLGGKVSSGVSGKTTHLLAIDLNSNSTKFKKAKELGIPIITPDQFKDLFNL